MPRKKKGTGDPSSRSTHSSLHGVNKEKPQQRNAANARERARMRVLSRAFHRLKTALAWVPPDTKLSKLDTLKMAVQHIAALKKTLESDDPSGQSSCLYPSMTMTWPFGLSRAPGGCGLGAEGNSEDGEDECGLDDGESLSCVSGSSWEEVKTEVTMTTQRFKDRSHLDHHGKTNSFTTDIIPPSRNDDLRSYHHPPQAHLPSTFHHHNLIFP